MKPPAEVILKHGATGMGHGVGIPPAWHCNTQRRQPVRYLPRRFRSKRFLLLWGLLSVILVVLICHRSPSAPPRSSQAAESVHERPGNNEVSSSEAKERSIKSHERLHNLRRLNEKQTHGSAYEQNEAQEEPQQIHEWVIVAGESGQGPEAPFPKPPKPNAIADVDDEDGVSLLEHQSDDQLELLANSNRLIEEEKVVEIDREKNGESEQHLDLESRAELQPDLIFIPLEEAVKDEKLAGWEDDWISNAVFEQEKSGALAEPKIDFVYLCTFVACSSS